MNARQFLFSLASPLSTRQLHRSQRRRISKIVRRAAGGFASESLEPRAMFSMSTPGATDAPTLNGVTEPPMAVATAITPRTFTVTWSWNQNLTIPDFNPAGDILALDWFTGSELRLADESGSAVLRIPGMQQSYRLEGVPLAQLTTANFTCKDSSATAYIAGVLAKPRRRLRRRHRLQRRHPPQRPHRTPLPRFHPAGSTRATPATRNGARPTSPRTWTWGCGRCQT